MPPENTAISWSRAAVATGSSIDEPPASRRSGFEGEPFVAVRRDFGTLRPVRADTAQIRHEHPRFAGNVLAHVPRVGLGQERTVGDLGDMRRPLFFRLGRRLDLGDLVVL